MIRIRWIPVLLVYLCMTGLGAEESTGDKYIFGKEDDEVFDMIREGSWKGVNDSLNRIIKKKRGYEDNQKTLAYCLQLYLFGEQENIDDRILVRLAPNKSIDQLKWIEGLEKRDKFDYSIPANLYSKRINNNGVLYTSVLPDFNTFKTINKIINKVLTKGQGKEFFVPKWGEGKDGNYPDLDTFNEEVGIFLSSKELREFKSFISKEMKYKQNIYSNSKFQNFLQKEADWLEVDHWLGDNSIEDKSEKLADYLRSPEDQNIEFKGYVGSINSEDIKAANNEKTQIIKEAQEIVKIRDDLDDQVTEIDKLISAGDLKKLQSHKASFEEACKWVDKVGTEKKFEKYKYAENIVFGQIRPDFTEANDVLIFRPYDVKWQEKLNGGEDVSGLRKLFEKKVVSIINDMIFFKTNGTSKSVKYENYFFVLLTINNFNKINSKLDKSNKFTSELDFASTKNGWDLDEHNWYIKIISQYENVELMKKGDNEQKKKAAEVYPNTSLKEYPTLNLTHYYKITINKHLNEFIENDLSSDNIEKLLSFFNSIYTEDELKEPFASYLNDDMDANERVVYLDSYKSYVLKLLDLSRQKAVDGNNTDLISSLRCLLPLLEYKGAEEKKWVAEQFLTNWFYLDEVNIPSSVKAPGLDILLESVRETVANVSDKKIARYQLYEWAYRVNNDSDDAVFIFGELTVDKLKNALSAYIPDDSSLFRESNSHLDVTVGDFFTFHKFITEENGDDEKYIHWIDGLDGTDKKIINSHALFKELIDGAYEEQSDAFKKWKSGDLFKYEDSYKNSKLILEGETAPLKFALAVNPDQQILKNEPELDFLIARMNGSGIATENVSEVTDNSPAEVIQDFLEAVNKEKGREFVTNKKLNEFSKASEGVPRDLFQMTGCAMLYYLGDEGSSSMQDNPFSIEKLPAPYYDLFQFLAAEKDGKQLVANELLSPGESDPSEIFLNWSSFPFLSMGELRSILKSHFSGLDMSLVAHRNSILAWYPLLTYGSEGRDLSVSKNVIRAVFIDKKWSQKPTKALVGIWDSLMEGELNEADRILMAQMTHLFAEGVKDGQRIPLSDLQNSLENKKLFSISEFDQDIYKKVINVSLDQARSNLVGDLWDNWPDKNFLKALRSLFTKDSSWVEGTWENLLSEANIKGQNFHLLLDKLKKENPDNFTEVEARILWSLRKPGEIDYEVLEPLFYNAETFSTFFTSPSDSGGVSSMYCLALEILAERERK